MLMESDAAMVAEMIPEQCTISYLIEDIRFLLATVLERTRSQHKARQLGTKKSMFFVFSSAIPMSVLCSAMTIIMITIFLRGQCRCPCEQGGRTDGCMLFHRHHAINTQQ